MAWLRSCLATPDGHRLLPPNPTTLSAATGFDRYRSRLLLTRSLMGAEAIGGFGPSSFARQMSILLLDTATRTGIRGIVSSESTLDGGL
jgi:hypothetical protein